MQLFLPVYDGICESQSNCGIHGPLPCHGVCTSAWKATLYGSICNPLSATVAADGRCSLQSSVLRSSGRLVCGSTSPRRTNVCYCSDTPHRRCCVPSFDRWDSSSRDPWRGVGLPALSSSWLRPCFRFGGD